MLGIYRYYDKEQEIYREYNNSIIKFQDTITTLNKDIHLVLSENEIENTYKIREIQSLFKDAESHFALYITFLTKPVDDDTREVWRTLENLYTLFLNISVEIEIYENIEQVYSLLVLLEKLALEMDINGDDIYTKEQTVIINSVIDEISAAL